MLRSCSKFMPSVKNIRCFSSFIDPTKTVVSLTTTPKVKVPVDELVFGRTFSDHMLVIDWSQKDGWKNPQILPYGEFTVSPACSALHYGVQCFEGMKAYKDSTGGIRLFRPDCNMERLNYSMSRCAMPGFNGDGFIECLKQILRIDSSWIPEKEGYSMYIRPTAIGTSPFLGVHASEEVRLFAILSPVGPYFKDGFNPIKLYADTENVRAWPGGTGNAKMGGNYAPAILPTEKAKDLGCSQILWLFGEDHQVTEVGSMNIFFVLKKRDIDGGGLELVTAPLTRGDILPGVTRRSIIDLTKAWNSKNSDANGNAHGMGNTKQKIQMEVSERWITMSELVQAQKENRLMESFGAGTAAVISPVRGIIYKGEEITFSSGSVAGPVATELWKELLDIQYGRGEQTDHPWSIRV